MYLAKNLHWKLFLIELKIRKDIDDLKKRILRYRSICTENRFIVTNFYPVFRWFRNHDRRIYHEWDFENEHTVCDYLGPIDTLGWRCDHGYYTGTYSSEMKCEQYIQLGPFVFTYHTSSGPACVCVEIGRLWSTDKPKKYSGRML